MSTLNLNATGVSPTFPVTAEEFIKRYIQRISFTSIQGVQPPTLGAQGGFSTAHNLRNRWFPWIDEKIVEPKYDGVSQFLGTPSNRPTLIKDYHMIAMMRAVDEILSPNYVGTIQVIVDTVVPISPPTGAATVSSGG